MEKYKSNLDIGEVPTLAKFEGLSREETEGQQKFLQAQANDKAAFYCPSEEWVFPAASTKEQEEREFVVDSWASMHMVSEKEHNSAELETMRTPRSPTT